MIDPIDVVVDRGFELVEAWSYGSQDLIAFAQNGLFEALKEYNKSRFYEAFQRGLAPLNK